jgi:hypothetical protein
MKVVENLTVQVTYRVGLGGVDMPKKVYKQLVKAAKNGDSIDPSLMEYSDVGEWLVDNIKERDCMDWQAEIEDIS